MRETLEEAAKKLLAEPVGTERTIAINKSDGLTGVPPGASTRGLVVKHIKVRVNAATRADGKSRSVVVALPKETVVAATTWK